jgi:iron complex outermembrane receptor protein
VTEPRYRRTAKRAQRSLEPRRFLAKSIGAASLVCFSFFLGASAQARQAASPIFHIPAQRVDDALLDLALQSRRSLGGDIGACRGSSPALNGSMTLETALTRLLAGSNCSFVIRADGAIFVHRMIRPPTSNRHSTPISPPPAAQDDPATQLSDIVVTSPRHPEIPQRVPAAIAAVSGAQLTATGAIDLNGIASLTAGMTVTNLGSGRNKILLRGMSDGAFTGLTQSTVALYLDRVPITYSAPDPDLKLIDIDRVELLRGPQGTLYGTGPIGGVVQIVTRRPEFTDTAMNISLTRSATHGGGPNSDYSVVGNLPLMGGSLAVRGVAYSERFGGYINDVSLNLHHVNEGSRQGGRLAVAASISPDWTVVAGRVHQTIHTEDTHYVFRTLGGLTRANLVREPHNNAFDETYVTVNGEGDWGRLDASVAVVRHRFDSRFDASSALPSFGSFNRIGALDESKNIDLLVGELTLASPDVRRLRWLVGAYYSDSETAADTAISVVRAIPLVVYTEARNDMIEEAAAFGEVSYDLAPGLTLTGGARVYAFEYETSSDVSQDNMHRPFHGTGRNEGLSPKLALAWKVNERLDVYGQITHGHRTGGFNTAGPIGQPFTGAVGTPAPRYRPDSLWNHEIGAKGIFWDGRVTARAAIFMARWNDIQSDQFLPSGLAYAVNVGDAANKGLEVETSWRITDRLEIRANGLLADPEITRPSRSFNSRGDAGLPGVPAMSANINTSYLRPLWRDISFSAEAGVAYVGASRLTFDAERRNRMGDYITGQVSAGLEGGRWSLRAFVDNPFDTEANTFSFGDPFRLPEALATTPLRPRTIGLTLQVSAF